VTGEPVADREERRFRDAGDRGAPPGGAREVTAILPSGRTIWLRVDAPLAPATSANHIALLAEREIDRRRADIASQARATERLSTAVAADIERLERAQLARARQLRGRIVSGDNRLDARLAKVREEFQSRLDNQLKIDRENLRRLRRRGFWDAILLATSLPLFASYGDRRSPFGTNNLTLVFLLLIWLVGDEVVEAVFGSGNGKSPYAIPDADAWSYLAPIGNILAAWWLLSDRQHERFITGVTTIKLDDRERHRVLVGLRDQIGADYFEDFKTFAGVPAVATIGAIRLSSEGLAVNPRIEELRSRVREGELTLSFKVVPGSGSLSSNLGEVDIAWIVDTDKPPSA
jgi:hypothetical protein